MRDYRQAKPAARGVGEGVLGQAQPCRSIVLPICTATAASILSAARVYICSTGAGPDALAEVEIAGASKFTACETRAATSCCAEDAGRASVDPAAGLIFPIGCAPAVGRTPYALAT